MRRRFQQLRLLPPDRDLVSAHVKAFLDAKRAAGRAESTLAYYESRLADLSAFIPDWPPVVEDIEAFLLHKRETVGVVSVRTNWRAAAVFLNWCERRGYLETNPIYQVDRPPNPRRLPKAVPQETIRKLFEVMARAAQQGETLGIRDHALFRLYYDTGARCSELAQLTFDDLDLGYQALVIRHGKGDQDRVTYFGQRCTSAMVEWLRIHPGGCEWVFVSRLRVELRPLTRGGIYKALQRWCKRAGVKLTVHQLRHSYATHGLRAGIDLEHVSRQLGHSTIETTAIYLASDDPARRKAHLEKSPGDRV